MKLLSSLLLGLLFLMAAYCHSQVAISPSGGSPDPSSAIDIQFEDRGLLMPRLTNEQRDAISNPAESLLIYNLTTGCFNFFRNSQWHELCGTPVVDDDCGVAFTDPRDSHTYATVRIGTQCWMAQNLAYLPEVHTNSQFQSQGENEQPGYGVYGYDGSDVATAVSQSNYATYGVLYNWYAVIQSGENAICPEDWHIPSDAEWTTLTDYLGSEYVAGGKMKSTAGWNPPNTAATNSSGFLALPGGGRYYGGIFYSVGDYGSWWSSTEDAFNAWSRVLNYNNGSADTSNDSKNEGFSCRCLRN